MSLEHIKTCSFVQQIGFDGLVSDEDEEIVCFSTYNRVGRKCVYKSTFPAEADGGRPLIDSDTLLTTMHSVLEIEKDEIYSTDLLKALSYSMSPVIKLSSKQFNHVTNNPGQNYYNSLAKCAELMLAHFTSEFYGGATLQQPHAHECYEDLLFCSPDAELTSFLAVVSTMASRRLLEIRILGEHCSMIALSFNGGDCWYIMPSVFFLVDNSPVWVNCAIYLARSMEVNKDDSIQSIIMKICPEYYCEHVELYDQVDTDSMLLYSVVPGVVVTGTPCKLSDSNTLLPNTTYAVVDLIAEPDAEDADESYIMLKHPQGATFDDGTDKKSVLGVCYAMSRDFDKLPTAGYVFFPPAPKAVERNACPNTNFAVYCYDDVLLSYSDYHEEVLEHNTWKVFQMEEAKQIDWITGRFVVYPFLNDRYFDWIYNRECKIDSIPRVTATEKVPNHGLLTHDVPAVEPYGNGDHVKCRFAALTDKTESPLENVMVVYSKDPLGLPLPQDLNGKVLVLPYPISVKTCPLVTDTRSIQAEYFGDHTCTNLYKYSMPLSREPTVEYRTSKAGLSCLSDAGITTPNFILRHYNTPYWIDSQTTFERTVYWTDPVQCSACGKDLCQLSDCVSLGEYIYILDVDVGNQSEELTKLYDCPTVSCDCGTMLGSTGSDVETGSKALRLEPEALTLKTAPDYTLHRILVGNPMGVKLKTGPVFEKGSDNYRIISEGFKFSKEDIMKSSQSVSFYPKLTKDLTGYLELEYSKAGGLGPVMLDRFNDYRKERPLKTWSDPLVYRSNIPYPVDFKTVAEVVVEHRDRGTPHKITEVGPNMFCSLKTKPSVAQTPGLTLEGYYSNNRRQVYTLKVSGSDDPRASTCARLIIKPMDLVTPSKEKQDFMKSAKEKIVPHLKHSRDKDMLTWLFDNPYCVSNTGEFKSEFNFATAKVAFSNVSSDIDKDAATHEA